MERVILKHNQLCALATEPKFIGWLHKISPELYSKLTSTHSKGCRSNAKLMAEIISDLKKSDKGNLLIDFIRTEYPATVHEDSTQTTAILIDNDKKVFKHYNPDILTFPQKLIMENSNRKQLEQDVKYFISDKLHSKYKIIDNRAYIEYILFKYRDEQIPEEAYEIKS